MYNYYFGLVNRSFAIFMNPQAGQGKSRDLVHLLTIQLEKKQFSYQVFSIDFPEKTAIQTYTDVVIVGGDGSVNFVINYFGEYVRPCNLSILTGGTGNDFARSLHGGILGIDQQIERILTGKPKVLDAGMCNQQYFLNGVGIGFDGAVVAKMQQRKWFSGHLAYYSAVVPLLFSYKEQNIHIQGQDWAMEMPVLSLAVANGRTFGGGFLMAPKADLNDGQFDVCLIKKTSLWQRLSGLPNIEKGLHLDLSFVSYFNSGDLQIRSNQALFAHIDGELVQSDEFSIKILPSYFKFL